MGISNSWFAVKGWTRDEALAELGFEIGRALEDEWPSRDFAIGEHPGGWLLVLNPQLEGAFEDRFVELSRRGPAAACAVEEHVMYHEARGYRDGVETWRILHDPEKGRSAYHLEVTG
jgi:hypothetical protein